MGSSQHRQPALQAVGCHSCSVPAFLLPQQTSRIREEHPRDRDKPQGIVHGVDGAPALTTPHHPTPPRPGGLRKRKEMPQSWEGAQRLSEGLA